MNRIALPLLALGFSLASALCLAAEPKADQAKAIAEIEKLGGKVEFDEKSPDRPVFSHGIAMRLDTTFLAHRESLAELSSLDLGYTNVGDADLVNLKGLTKLKSLNLLESGITDAGLKNLRGLTQLESLDLADTTITDAGLIHSSKA